MPKETTRGDRLESAHAEMVEAIESTVTGEDWARMLETAARFHRYSAQNVWMILAQRPDATQVAGYRTWQSMGRQVRKGERGLRILAPCVYRRTEDDGTEHAVLRGFTTVSVFDVSQTDGDELPDPVAPVLLEGEAPSGAREALEQAIRSAGFALHLEVPWHNPSANGSTSWSDRVVSIRPDLSPAQTVKTMIHELAHVRLDHHVGCHGPSEVEAESVAHLVCAELGVRSDSYSFPYVARWADGSVDLVRDTAARVIGCARAILEQIKDTDAEQIAA